jgi:hypothetical protein
MAAPQTAREDASSHTISINATDGSCTTIHVKPGDKVQWQAPASSNAWVSPPNCFAACSDTITIPAGQTLPSPACVVTGNPNTYGYSSGLGDPPGYRGVATGDNDSIVVDSSQP